MANPEENKKDKQQKAHLQESKSQETKKDIKHIVRIGNTDLVGEKAIHVALLKIKGIGIMVSMAVCRLAKVNPMKKAGLLTEDEVQKLNEIVLNLDKYNVPEWMKNRKNEFETGKTTHLLLGNLDFAVEQDLRRMKKIKSYKGVRHVYGLTVRGQRTKSNFRKNKGKVVGVKKKADAKAGKV
ncbi:MAG: 30S ribosomal protein S13 [Candidatus Woesearchaeota archaeon]